MSDTFPIRIYHNPDCGTSRNVLAIIKAAGYSPTVVLYRKVGWTQDLLAELLLAMQAKPRALLREKGTRAAELGLMSDTATDEMIIAAMVADPVLVNRPIVVSPLGAKLCRPSEVVLTLLASQPGSFVKEDGEVVR